jgi:hypothetical protein
MAATPGAFRVFDGRIGHTGPVTDDPDRADVHVRTGDGTPVPDLTDDLLAELLDDPPDPDCPFIMINRGDHEYIQTRLLPDGVYELEHRAAGADGLFQMYTSDARHVRDVMWAWVDENPMARADALLADFASETDEPKSGEAATDEASPPGTMP